MKGKDDNATHLTIWMLSIKMSSAFPTAIRVREGQDVSSAAYETVQQGGIRRRTEGHGSLEGGRRTSGCTRVAVLSERVPPDLAVAIDRSSSVHGDMGALEEPKGGGVLVGEVDGARVLQRQEKGGGISIASSLTETLQRGGEILTQ
jgi:hypothetical protein